jgi:hypothetical protein
MSKFNRDNFYKQVTVNGILENDLINYNWDLFQIKRPLQYVTLTNQFIQRPDLLSYYLYRDQSYWWILAKYNNLDDWWNDVSSGMNISVPSLQDISDWQLRCLGTK